MKKEDCLYNYFCGTRAFYLYLLGNVYNNNEYKNFILDREYLIGAKMSFISNIMLAIKEDIVSKGKNLTYDSLVFISSLEESVLYIANKVDGGYKLGNYIFSSSALLVSVVRNKLAHGDYVIDFEHNRFIFNYDGTDIVVNVDKFVNFIMNSFINKIKNIKTMKYERNIVYYTKNDTNREKKITERDEVRGIIKNSNYINFVLKSINGLPVRQDCMHLLGIVANECGREGYNYLFSKKYKDYVNEFNRMGCELSFECKNVRNKDEINRITDFAMNEIVGNDNLGYNEQVMGIGYEIQKSINRGIYKFDTISANINNLFLLDAISKTMSVDFNSLSNYLFCKYNNAVKSSYDEYGVCLISMFNALLLYPFDDILDTKGGYKADRSNCFDFSLLDLSMINPSVIEIDKSALIEKESRLNSIVKNEVDVVKKINIQKDNLKKTNNVNAVSNINNNINYLNGKLTNLFNDYIECYHEYSSMLYDYDLNNLYFRNKTIIEGIRNSIAHGSYEFISKGNFLDTVIIFEDVYNDKLTFKLEISFKDFENFIDSNYNIVLENVIKKNGLNNKKK